MSSFDPLRQRAVEAEFELLAHTRERSPALTTASIFPDLSTPAPPGGGAPPTAREELEAARQAAYAAGFAAGKAAAEEETSAGAAALAAAVEEVARFRAGLLDRYQRELLELALGVARKVVQRELAEHPEHWMEMIREAVRRTIDRETIRIRVGTILHHVLVEQLPRLRALLEDVRELDLVEDPTLGEAGCVIESRYGDLDLGIDSQMSAIRSALAAVS
jgi:flagellar assembly protein FliH